ncbi:MAG: hypothetical protein IJ991_07955 [Thermoguttaceae bacterium]|nr:hypothetical protein [Thermoguttaceae bacterium]
MNLKTWLLLLVALLTGGAAALGVKSIFFVESEESVEDVAVALGTETQILVANVDMPAGTELTARNVRLTLTPESEIPREERPLTFSEAVGALTARDLKAGEPISLFDVAVPEASASPEETYVKPGYTIVPIEIQTATKAGGGRDFLKTTKLDKMLKPGDLVDLAVVKEDKSVASSALGAAPRRRLTTETIVEGAEVFSVSDASRFSQETGAAERASTVCVQLSQEQLAATTKAAEQGRVKIIPRAEQVDFEAGATDAPLAFDGGLGGAAFEPPMNADFSFSGLTEEAPASEFETVVDVETSSEPARDASATDALVPFEIAVEDETSDAVEEPEANATAISETTPPTDALVPFEIAVEDETPDAVEEAEADSDSEKETPFRLRNASVRSESDEELEEAEEEGENGEEPASDAAAPIAPSTEPRQASETPATNAPTYRESFVETSVADEASAESAPTAVAKEFKYVSPFVTVDKKRNSSSVAPTVRANSFSR